MEIYPGVYVSGNIAAKAAERTARANKALQEVEAAKPLVRSAVKLVVYEDYKVREEMAKAARIFAALEYGVLSADYLEPNNSRIMRFCKALQSCDLEAVQKLYLAAMECGYKLALDNKYGADVVKSDTRGQA